MLDAFHAAWANLPYNGELFFVAAVVFFGAGMAWLRGPHRGRVWLLLAASFYFYASVTLWLALLIFASTILDYCLAHGIRAAAERPAGARRSSPSASPPTSACCAISNTPISFSARCWPRCTAAARPASFPLLSILAPLGISFYTFEAINYIVDVYRGRVPAGA